MSTYTLNPIHRIDDHQCIVSLSLDGEHQGIRCSFVTLFLSRNYTSGAMAWVQVPPSEYEDLLDLIDRPASFQTMKGWRVYDFDSHDAALTFLRRLYGIDTPQPTPEPLDATPGTACAPQVQCPPVSPASVSAPLARNVVPSPVPVSSTRTAARAFFNGTATYSHPKRNTQ